jgi:peptidyl-prolyl cis-trans isomerase D
MFDFVRSHNRLFQIILGVLIIPSFIAFGIQSYSSMRSDDSVAVAEVDGHAITRAEWDNQHRQDTQTLQRQRPNVDLKTLDTPEARRASLDALVRDRVLQAAVAHQDLVINEDRIRHAWQTSPEFQQLRALPSEQQAAVLAQQGMTINSLADRIGSELARLQALQGVTVSGMLPATSLKAATDAWFDQREIQWQRYDVKDYAAAAAPTDAQIQAYYADKAHAADFLAPEQARIQYVVLDVDTLKAQVTAPDGVLRSYYDSNKAAFTVPEERRASHILINVAPKASDADIAKAKAQAEALLAEVRKNPASFADVAKKSSQDGGSAAQGGDLDFMRKDAIPGAFSDALFALKQGEISNVVRSDAGFHIIELTAVRGGAAKPYDEVKAQIEDQYRTQEAQKLYAAEAEKFTNTVYEQPDSLQPAIAAYKLAAQTATVSRSAAPGATGPLASRRLLDAVFADESIKGKHNTEAVETASSQLTAAHVVEYTPRHARPLAEVREQIVAALTKAQAAAAAARDGAARVAAATKDAALALPLTATVSRLNPGADVPREVVLAALKADISKGPAVTGLALPDGGYAAIRVVKSVPRAADDAESARAKSLFEQAFEDAESQAVYEALKTRYKVKYHEDRISKSPDAAASSAN